MTAFLTVFVTVFLAELGDKTQLATVLFAAEGNKPNWLVFAGATAALATSTAIAVLLGAAADRWLTMLPLKLLAGIGFVVIGVLLIGEHARTA
ncbi:MAG: TMEM165/GDT1 family protein [Alphaproteobacteria bacterium]|nr:TMEM165/GDT1 family protein [Alphaproteobacteria bacterium]